MRSDALTLGFDSSAAHCAVALASGGEIIACRHQDMSRGQAERLFPLIDAAMADAGLKVTDLTAIGVGIGPGNFTGIRIAVAAARGLGLSLGVPAFGIDSFEASQEVFGGIPVMIAAPRDQVYVRDAGGVIDLMVKDAALVAIPDLSEPPNPAQIAQSIARLAGRGIGACPPAPLYLRPANAAPARDLPPVILDDA